MRRAMTAVGLAILVSGCADSHRMVRQGDQSNHLLSASDSVYVAVPRDGIYETRTYNGSGLNTANILVSAFSRHSQNATSGRGYQEYKEALKYAKESGYTVLVYPTILHWEDRATEWSGKRDRVEIKVEVARVSDEKVVTSGIIKGASGLATLGGDHPQDLLPKPIGDFVATLF